VGGNEERIDCPTHEAVRQEPSPWKESRQARVTLTSSLPTALRGLYKLWRSAADHSLGSYHYSEGCCPSR
jgi:hypothetical protein